MFQRLALGDRAEPGEDRDGSLRVGDGEPLLTLTHAHLNAIAQRFGLVERVAACLRDGERGILRFECVEVLLLCGTRGADEPPRVRFILRIAEPHELLRRETSGHLGQRSITAS